MESRFYFIFLVSVVFSGFAQPSSEKINGISFVASRDKVEQEHVDPIVKLYANYAAVMPFGFIRSLEHPNIMYNQERQWFGETRAGAKQYIEMLHQNGIKVMVKPQIWISHGAFTGYIKMTSEEAWKELEASYSTFILEYASLAQECDVAMFCIGTELEQFIVHRPKYWETLILEIKDIYKGKLTYAANWDEYKRVPFWKQLDFIGVDAYFPVSESKTPTIEECKLGWQPWLKELKEVSKRNSRKIIFTEFGYRSVDFSAKEPWKSDYNMTTVNLAAQTNATRALFEMVWDQPWYEGGFIWKWYINHKGSGGDDNARFTPQNKPVEETIRLHYKSSK